MSLTFARAKRVYLPLLAAAFMVFWIAGTVTAIAASGERGADTRADLFVRASAALRAGDPAAFDELLLDGAGSGFTDDYVSRLTVAGPPRLAETGTGSAEIRAGVVVTTLSVTEEQGRWYLSLLPPQPSGGIGPVR